MGELKSLSITMQMKKNLTLLHFRAGCLQRNTVQKNYLSSKPTTSLQPHLTVKKKILIVFHFNVKDLGNSLQENCILLGGDWGGSREGGCKKKKDVRNLKVMGGGPVVTVKPNFETYSKNAFLETSFFRRPTFITTVVVRSMRMRLFS